jgi:ABC-type lipoprotein release transport system permease subunit
MSLIKRFHKVGTIFRVARLLAMRQIFRGNFWVNLLIIVVMFISIVNLIGVSGILVGILEGSFKANRIEYTGDVFIETLSKETEIENTQQILSILDNLPQVAGYSARYRSGSSVEANYDTRRDFSILPESVSVPIVGINPEDENSVTTLSTKIVEGEWIDESESGYIVIGSILLERYSSFSDQIEPLKNIYPGTRVKITVSNSGGDVSDIREGVMLDGENSQSTSRTQEFIVKGILDTKSSASSAAYMTESDYRKLTGRNSLRAQQIAIKSAPGVSDQQLKSILQSYDIENNAKLRTAQEAIPKFLDDIKQVFSLLGVVIGSIGIVVASITIFIVIYINALTRRKFIGILKGIGISRKAIELAYVIQSLFYALAGSALALSFIYFVGVPYFNVNPLDFPFSDGILVAPFKSTSIRILILIVITLIAGFLPAWLIVRKNTLDSILLR